MQDKCHPQTIEVCRTRAEGLGLKVEVGNEQHFNIDKDTCGILLQYPATDGAIHDYKVRVFTLLSLVPVRAACPGCTHFMQVQVWLNACYHHSFVLSNTNGNTQRGQPGVFSAGRAVNFGWLLMQALAQKAHDAKAQVVAATDLLALTVIQPPSEWGADVVVGSAQRFGVPMGYGGPHAAFLACETQHKRLLPGRIIGAGPSQAMAPILAPALATSIAALEVTANLADALVTPLLVCTYAAL